MERDPHQLIEGILIACYAIGCAQAFLYVRGEMALAQERIAAGAQRGLRRRLRRARTSSAPTSRSTSSCTWGAGAYIVGEETGADREPRGQPRHAAAQAAVLPRGQGPLPAAHHRQQRRDAVEPARGSSPTAPSAFTALGAEASKGTRMFAVSGHVKKPGVFEVEYGVTTFRDLIYAPVYAGGIRGGHALKAFIPGGASAPLVLRGAPRPAAREGHRRQGRLDARLGRHRRDGRDHRRGQGLPAGGALLRPRVVRQVHAVPRGHHLARADPAAHHSTAMAGPSDLDLLMDVCDNISPGIAWPPKQTTICPLGPSAVSPIVVGAAAVPRRVRGPHRQGRAVARSPVPARPPCRRRGRRTGGSAWLTDAGPTAADAVERRARHHRRRRPSWPRKGELVIEAAERNGVYIPRFCYHPRMEPVGMCRMCIVEIDTGRGPGAAAQLHARVHART